MLATAVATPPELQAAIDTIDREFSNPNGSALRMCRTMLKVGAAHPAAKARYGWIVTQLLKSDQLAADAKWGLHYAIGFVRCLRTGRRAAYDRASAINPNTRYAVSAWREQRMLTEAYILLRVLRRYAPRDYQLVLAAIIAPVPQAAE